ncbi:hypothetical protein CKK33_06200 [Mucilaginibacter sp. MD40]|nr:hypothetical protein CKK33_06200 [Mucilaginibacter sp. MD40]
MHSYAYDKIEKKLAKKIIFTVATSFPCLLAAMVTMSVLFLVPGILIFWIANNYLPDMPKLILTILGLFLFVTIIAVCSLYLWYFVSNIVYKRVDNKPLSEFLEKDKVYKYLKIVLLRLRIINS